MLIESPANLPDLKIITPKIFPDDRGYFFESYSRVTFSKEVGNFDFCQDNESFSTYGVLRGLHFQLPPFEQTKLVRVVYGKIWDVAIDLRPRSASFKKWFALELSAENKIQLLIPKGFAHGFLTLSEGAVVNYKVDTAFTPKSDRGVCYDDKDLGIAWPKVPSLTISPKDKALPNLKSVMRSFQGT